MHPVKFIAALFLTYATCMSVMAQSEGQAINEPAAQESEATRRLTELCQNPDATAEAMESVLRDGADLDALIEVRMRIAVLGNRESMTKKRAFQVAVMTIRNPQVIQLMIDAGAKVTGRVVELAVRHNPNPKVIEELLALRSQLPNAREPNWISLFGEACQSNQSVAVIQWFMEIKGQDLNEPNDANVGITPFQTACGTNLNPEVIELLINNGGDLKATRSGGISPLMFAAMSNTPEISELLIESGAEVNYRTHKGMNAYLYASLSSRYPGIFQVLVGPAT